MKASIVAASAALIGSVAAAHKGHAMFHWRRDAAADVCTVYTTVYVYPTDIPAPVSNTTVLAQPTPVVVSTSSTPAPPPSSSKAAFTPQPASSAPAYTPAPAPSSTQQAVSKPSSSPSYGGSGGRIVVNGDKWAITYTPYTAKGDCKSASEVKSDIAKIAGLGFTTIRSYSTDCGVFENVIPAVQSHGLKIIYGIFLEGGGKSGKGVFSDYANSQLKEIISNAPKDSVAMLIVGNEAIFNNYVTASELAEYLNYVREQLRGAGFPSDIAVTTTEPVDVWQTKGKPLCSAIDLFTVQVHPFFTSKVTASGAGDFAKEQLEMAAAVCPEAAAKGKYISEIGWPRSGVANGLAIPGVSQQKEAIKSIVAKVGSQAAIFSFQDDLWKAAGSFGVEQSFGCSSIL